MIFHFKKIIQERSSFCLNQIRKKSIISKYKVGEKMNATVMEIKPDDKKIVLFVEELGGDKSTTKNDVQEFLDNQIEPVGEKIEIPNENADQNSDTIED